MSEPRFRIEPARNGADFEVAAGLFTAYASSIGIDLGYQDFSAELDSLPGKYAPPAGELLLARDTTGETFGCVALRPMTPEGCCEMKRLYVAPRGRGLGLGAALMNAIVDVATRIGYREMRLDTLSTMDAAIALYRKGGFVEIPAYYDTPIQNTVFMARDLSHQTPI